uniref:BAR domain-containing protein n=1 Tax=Mesocestoides corti TaxID=53468 RepID=A0A5K3F246_MESCO
MRHFRSLEMSFSEKLQQFFDSATVGINRITQISDEVFGTQNKTRYDEATIKLFACADMTYKVCTTLKKGIDSTITPNPARRVFEKITKEFNSPLMTVTQISENLANVASDCALELPGTEISVTLSQCAEAYRQLGKSECEFAFNLRAGILAVISEFLNSFWPDLQKERRKLDLLRIDYDWARNNLKQKDEARVTQAKEEFDRQLYRTQVLLKQCEITRNRITVSLAEMATQQWHYFSRCKDIMQHLIADVNPEFV